MKRRSLLSEAIVYFLSTIIESQSIEAIYSVLGFFRENVGITDYNGLSKNGLTMFQCKDVKQKKGFEE